MKIPRQMLISIVGAVLVAVLFFMFVLKPKMAQISDVRDDVAAAKSEAATLEQQIAKLEDVRTHEPELRARLNAVSGYLPSRADLPDFIRQIQAASTSAGVDLKSIAPSPPIDIANTTGIQQINVTLVVEGSFYRLQDLLARIESMRRIVEVSSISVAPQIAPESTEVTLQSTLSLKMFVVEDNAHIGKTTVGSNPSPSASASP